jgi:hypothetical protein
VNEVAFAIHALSVVVAIAGIFIMFALIRITEHLKEIDQSLVNLDPNAEEEEDEELPGPPT